MATSPCIRCGFIPAEKDQYCIRCGAPLQNRCTNDGGLLGDPCTTINRPNAAFCATCGAPTLFQKKGLIAAVYPPTSTEEDEWNTMDLFTRPFFTSF